MTSEEGGGGGDSNKWSVEIQKAKGGSIKSEIEGRSLLMITLGSWYERDIRYIFFKLNGDKHHLAPLFYFSL